LAVNPSATETAASGRYQACRLSMARADDEVAPHEPREVEEDRVGREQQRQRDDLAVAEPVAEQQRRQREEAAEQRRREPHGVVAPARHREHEIVHVVEERAVDDGPVVVGAGPDVVEDPVGDPPLVPVGDAVAEQEEPGEEGERDGGEHPEHDGVPEPVTERIAVVHVGHSRGGIRILSHLAGRPGFTAACHRRRPVSLSLRVWLTLFISPEKG
jgi:hypothetical protein